MQNGGSGKGYQNGADGYETLAGGAGRERILMAAPGQPRQQLAGGGLTDEEVSAAAVPDLGGTTMVLKKHEGIGRNGWQILKGLSSSEPVGSWGGSRSQ